MPRPVPDQPSAPPVSVHHDTVIVGAGFGGLGLAIRLRQAGQHDFVVLEQAQAVGGTWRDNTYPGCACDIPAVLYSFSFARDWPWSRRYPSQPEIRAYLEHCVDRFGIRPHLRLGTGLAAARFDAAAGLWRLETSAGPMTARALVLGLGALHRPALPGIPGREDFAGHAFHTASWDHTADPAGKRVAVIGTGASAIQIVPALAGSAAQVTLFQRTPAWVLPKHDPRTGPLRHWVSRNAGWLDWLARAWTFWSHESRAVAFVTVPRLLGAAERRARSFAKGTITDDALRARLTPDYAIGCKHILLSNDFLPTMARPDVSLVTEPIRRIVADGVETADGALHKADMLVFATGFRTTDPFGAVTVVGADGQRLDQAAASWMGVAVPGFPNLFLLGGPNTGLGHNSIVFMLEAQIGRILRELRKGGVHALRPEAARGFGAWLDRRMQRTVWLSGCRSWYLDATGRNTTLWPGYCVGYWLRTRFGGRGVFTAAPSAERRR